MSILVYIQTVTWHFYNICLTRLNMSEVLYMYQAYQFKSSVLQAHIKRVSKGIFVTRDRPFFSREM